MATRLIFEDENNEMECFLNKEGKVNISVSNKEDKNLNGNITLDKDDVIELIKILKDAQEQMKY